MADPRTQRSAAGVPVWLDDLSRLRLSTLDGSDTFASWVLVTAQHTGR